VKMSLYLYYCMYKSYTWAWHNQISIIYIKIHITYSNISNQHLL
jgi:hypothetical protein